MRLPRLHAARGVAAETAIAATFLAAGCSSEDIPHDPHSTGNGSGVNLTILAAASTRVINDDLQALTPYSLHFVNAGSSELVQQVRDGAEGDVLITADKKNMDDAVNDGLARTPQEIATNSMVLVVPKGNPAGIHSVEDVQRDGVNLVLCDPQVPCGSVANELVSANQLTVHPASLEHSVSDTLGKVTSGEADAAFVYRTDAKAAGDEVETIDIPHADEHPNTLYAAVLDSANRQNEAELLIAQLRSAEMVRVWEEHGFTPARS